MLTSKKHDEETQARMDFFAYLVIVYALVGMMLISFVSFVRF